MAPGRRRVREGDGSVCIIGVGRLLAAAEAAADELAISGIRATVWDPRVVKPLDASLVVDAARHDLVVVAEDGVRVGGAGSAIATAIEDLGPATLPRVRTLGVPDRYLSHAKPDVILARLGLDAAGIAATVRSNLGSPVDLRAEDVTS